MSLSCDFYGCQKALAHISERRVNPLGQCKRNIGSIVVGIRDENEFGWMQAGEGGTLP